MKTAGECTSDIFSLGCTFFEMYAVLKGRRIHDLTSSQNASRSTPYRETISELLNWLDTLDTQDEIGFTNVLRQMIDQDPERRLSAMQIHETLKTCYTSTQLPFCGSFCRQ